MAGDGGIPISLTDPGARDWADYSTDGDAWQYLPDELSRSKAYRWGEDGFAGIYDRFQLISFAPTFWNESDTHLKDQLFGLTQPSGPLHDPDEFLDASGHRAVWGDAPRFRDAPQWRDKLFFYEYFHDDTAARFGRVIRLVRQREWTI